MRRLLLLFASLSLAAQTAPPEPSRDLLIKTLREQHRLLNDYGGLLHYGSDNAELPKPAPGQNRVVFLGDQTTEEWGRGKAAFFPGKPYLNRGIAGQTSSQMLVRFRQDVIDLQPVVVVILAGLNDISGVRGPVTEEMVADNLMTMTELAQVHGIKVVLASVLPICDCFEKSIPRQRRYGRIVELNESIKQLAEKRGFAYLDYYSALVDDGGVAMKKELTTDGILPDDAGYEKMSPLAEEAIEKAIGKKR